MKKYLSNSLFFTLSLAFIVIFSVTSIFALYTDQNEDAEGIDDAVILGELRQNVIAPSCLDNYTDLPYSEEYTSDNSWSLNFLPFEGWNSEARRQGATVLYFDSPNPRREYFMDINRDGLVDYLYAVHVLNIRDRVVLNREIQECVLLNNGHGWELSYRCHGTISLDNNTGDFYGDCALIEEE